MSTSTASTSGDGTCCCSGSGGDVCDCTCCNAAGGYWTEYKVTAAGFTDGTGPCPDPCVTDRAKALNGTFRIKKRPGNCSWKTDEQFDALCDDLPTTAPYWDLGCPDVVFGGWEILAGAGIRYKSPIGGTFDCLTGGTLAIEGATVTVCFTAPATITLTPAGVFVPCP